MSRNRCNINVEDLRQSQARDSRPSVCDQAFVTRRKLREVSDCLDAYMVGESGEKGILWLVRSNFATQLVAEDVVVGALGFYGGPICVLYL